MSNQDVVKFGDTLYLKHESGQYLVNVERGRYNWPKLGNTGKVKLRLFGSEGGVQPDSKIKIQTTEEVTGNNNVLGAFVDSHDCYYWQDGYDDTKQSWRITKASGEAGPIVYGDRVRISNISYSNQRLAPDTKNQGYITTVENAGDSWILESAAVKPVAQPNTSTSLKVFNWSVASGDPTESGVILWTRVNPKAYDRTTPLKYQVARDQNFQQPIIEGQVNASEFSAETDYTVRIDLNGKLEANQRYFYRFIYKDVSSPIGRCKTLPAANAELSKLRLAVLTCNDYSTGYFNGFYKLAEEDVDFVIHVGDFAYEYPEYPPGYGEIIRTDLKLDDKESGQYNSKGTSGGKRATTLANFRRIYRTYREDLALQAAMEKHTWIIILDDHEIADNAYWDYEHNTLGAHPSHAIYERHFYYGPENLKEIKEEVEDAVKEFKAFAEKNYYPEYEEERKKIPLEELEKKKQDCRQEMRRLYEEAVQAWKEYVPARVTQDVSYEVEVNGKKEKHWRYKLYRNFRFGKLVDFYLTDSRSFRDKAEWKKSNGIYEKAVDLKKEQRGIPVAGHIASARKINNDGKTPPDWKWSMLGPEQKQWLINGINKSDALWRVWGNQTLLATSSVAGSRFADIDDWYAYMGERYEILKTIKEEEIKRPNSDDKVSRFVVFTGDMHTSLIAYLKTDFDGYGYQDCSQLAGVEFMTPSLTSPGIGDAAYAKGGGAATILASIATEVAPINSYIREFNSRINGYAIAEFTGDELKWDVYKVDKLKCDELKDGQGSNVRKVSTKRAEKQLHKSVTYNPKGIDLGI